MNKPVKKPILIFFQLVIFTTVVIMFFAHSSTAILANMVSTKSLTLKEDGYTYTIENDYYRVQIPKSSSSEAKGIIKHLYIKRTDGNWSKDLVYQGYSVYGLGYLEGTNDSSYDVNSSYGMQNNPNTTVEILENSQTEIVIQSFLETKAAKFTETWTFWGQKEYFQSDAIVEGKLNLLTNQQQFAWMVNSELPMTWYGTNTIGNVEEYSTRLFQPLNSLYLNTYPWINWSFTQENVSLGMIFTDIYGEKDIWGETGDQPFEYQLDFGLGSGSLANPTQKGLTREITTTYLTSDQASYIPIKEFASSAYVNSSTISEQSKTFQASAYAIDAYGQNDGISSALINSPYFLVRQNSQNMVNHLPQGPEYLTSIYAPLYKEQKSITKGAYDFKDQLQYSLNYTDGKTTFNYGTIYSAEVFNSDFRTSLIHNANSNDNRLLYTTNFNTWTDSDKLQITGNVRNNVPEILMEDIYISLLAIPQDSIEMVSLLNLGHNIYELRFEDTTYGRTGIGIKIVSPINNIELSDNQLRVYLVKQDQATPLENFDFSFEIELFPHSGWFNTFSDFTTLHSKDSSSYLKHNFYVPLGIHSEVTNIISTDGAITYYPRPYKQITSKKFNVIPSTGIVAVSIEDWRKDNSQYRRWFEFVRTPDIVTWHQMGGLYPNSEYSVSINHRLWKSIFSNDLGFLEFSYSNLLPSTVFEIQPNLCIKNIRQSLLNWNND